jgi:hypothetical protein
MLYLYATVLYDTIPSVQVLQEHRTELMQSTQQRLHSNDATEIAMFTIEESNLSKRIRTLEASDQSAKIDIGQDF